MVLSHADKIVIETLFKEKGWRGSRICQEFPNKNWSVRTINFVIRKIETTGSTARRIGSGRPKTARTADNIEYVEEFVSTQEDNPGTQKSARKIAQDLDISRTSVRRILKKDLALKSCKSVQASRNSTPVKEKRRIQSRHLLNIFKELDEPSTNSADDEKSGSPSVQPGSDTTDENSMENNANNVKVNNNNNDSDSSDGNGMEEIPQKFKHQLKHQELFLSRQVETLPATHIHGKCCVTLLNETDSLLSYLNKDDTFVYSLHYGRQQKTFLADKGEIRVGSKYQADSIPLVLADADYDRKSEDLEELVWDPNHELTEKEIDQFQIIARSVGTYARALDCTNTVHKPSLHMSAATASRDITIFHAMETLHQQRYDLTKAIKSLVPSGGPVLCRDEMEEWTASEANLFEDAIEKYRKDFNDIRQDFLPWKSLKSIVEYYYMWKTTDRYVQQKRIKASEAKESKLKEVYIPNYNKPNSAAITSKMNGLDNQVSGRMCKSESCHKS